MKITTNYHTHTYRCKHADGDIDDYCRAAIKKGLTTLGFSDHTPFIDNKWLAIRMNINELDDYCNALDRAQVKFPELTILKGMECEYRVESEDFLRDELLGNRDFDYLVLGPHFFPYEGEYLCSYGGPVNAATLWAYTDHLVEAMQTGLFAFVAHPDLFGNSYITWDDNCIACSREILRTAEQLKIPLEINGCGIRKGKKDFGGIMRYQYPLEDFWSLASEYDITVIVNSDAHTPGDIIDSMQTGYDMAELYNLKLADMTYLERP